MNDILAQIIARKAERIGQARQKAPLSDLIATMPTSVGNGRFIEPLRVDRINIIAEIKHRSPSKGIIRENFNPVEIARNYTLNGAAAISVLTEEDFFDGSLDYLRRVREITDLPLLRKDFIFDEYQLYETAHSGADAVLLIAALLDDVKFNDLLQITHSLGMDALVEVHDRAEIDRVMKYDIKLLGINNRDLRTFATTLNTSLELAGGLPPTVTLVSESGIRKREDIDGLRTAGFHAFLIGEELMRADDEGKALKDLIVIQ